MQICEYCEYKLNVDTRDSELGLGLGLELGLGIILMVRVILVIQNGVQQGRN